MSLVDRIGIIALVLLLLVGAPSLVGKGNNLRNAECVSRGGQVVTPHRGVPSCVLPQGQVP